MIELVGELGNALEERSLEPHQRGEGVELRLPRDALRRLPLQLVVLHHGDVGFVVVGAAEIRHEAVDAVCHTLLRLGDVHLLLRVDQVPLHRGKSRGVRVGFFQHVDGGDFLCRLALDVLDGDDAAVAGFTQLHECRVQPRLLRGDGAERRLIGQQHLTLDGLGHSHRVIPHGGGHLPQQVARHAQLPRPVRNLGQHDVVFAHDAGQPLIFRVETLGAVGDAPHALLASLGASLGAQVPRHRGQPVDGGQRAGLVGEVVVHVDV